MRLHLLAALAASALWGEGLVVDAPPKPLQLDHYPQDGVRVRTNPPGFVWVPVAGAARYVVEVSRTADFAAASTLALPSEITLQVPRRTMEAGTWYWRYGALAAESSQPVYSRARRFEIPRDALPLPFPDVTQLVRQLSGKHPRIGIRPADLDKVRTRAKGDMQWAAAPVIAAAERAIGGPLFPEPAFLPPQGDPNRGAQYQRTFTALRPFLAGMVAAADAYLLTADERFGHEARRRLMHIMTWDPDGSTSLKNNDEPGMQMPRDAARTYDYIYPLLAPAERRKVCEVLAVRLRQIHDTLRRRPFESNPFESHSLGSYVNNLTEGLLAMAGDLPVTPMLEYALMQFWSPYYPPFGGEDGGWSEGPSYWSWSAGRMARTFALIEMNTGARISQRPWLLNTPYFKMYVNPPYSRMAPFGDSQDNTVGFDTMYALGAMLRNPYALWYAGFRKYRPQGMDAFLYEQGGLEPRAPEELPQARAFFDAGVVAMHSALADASRNVQVLLRSSPFGSTSHSYADQNSFVLQAFGEPLAISSGYYDYYGSPPPHPVDVADEGAQFHPGERRGPADAQYIRQGPHCAFCHQRLRALRAGRCACGIRGTPRSLRPPHTVSSSARKRAGDGGHLRRTGSPQGIHLAVAPAHRGEDGRGCGRRTRGNPPRTGARPGALSRSGRVAFRPDRSLSGEPRRGVPPEMAAALASDGQPGCSLPPAGVHHHPAALPGRRDARG